MPLERFRADDLRRFLTAVDAHLTCSATIIVLGGSAIALYGVAAGTIDIDTWETNLRPLEPAIARARKETGLAIPVVPAGVADVPYHAQDRLRKEPTPWAHLQVFMLEPHDLALSKAVRGNESDLAAIEQLHRVAPLDLNTLVTRYLDEMGHAVGDPTRIDTNFVLLIERLYGEATADRVEKRIHGRRGASKTR